MKSLCIGVVLGLMSLISLTLRSQQPQNNEPTREQVLAALEQYKKRDKLLDPRTFLSFVGEYKKLHRVTQVPDQMSPNTAGLCIEPKSNSEVHGDRFCDVYVTPNAKDAMEKGHIESCVSCHDDYAKSDFVTRTYMKKQTAK